MIVLKLVTVMPGAAATVQATLLACDRASGEPLAVLDGEAVTLRRTAATSALAARHLARADAHTLLVVGTGRLAPWMARAHVALRPGLQRVQVWGRRAGGSRRPGRASCAAEGLPAEPVQRPRAGSARRLHRVLRHHRDRAAGARRVARAGHAPRSRGRLPTDTCARSTMRRWPARASSWTPRAGALAEAGDLVQPLERGVIDGSRIVAELAQLLGGAVPGRTRADEITLFKSVGTALADLAAAQLVVLGDGAARQR